MIFIRQCRSIFRRLSQFRVERFAFFCRLIGFSVSLHNIGTIFRRGAVIGGLGKLNRIVSDFSDHSVVGDFVAQIVCRKRIVTLQRGVLDSVFRRRRCA